MSSFFEDEKNLRIKGYFSLVGHSLTTLLTGNTLSLLHFSNYYSSYLSENELEIPKYYSRIFINLLFKFKNYYFYLIFFSNDFSFTFILFF